MSSEKKKPRLAVVSPFLGKSYGTERTVIEWLNHLPDAFEIHIYSQNVEDLDPDRFIWHRIPKLPGPHFLILSGGSQQIIYGGAWIPA